MKHSRIDYKNDIKVLGRVVSIATENKVAEAEQIFDTTFKYGNSPEGMDQYEINRLLRNAIVNIESNITKIPALENGINGLNNRVSALEDILNELEACCREVQNRLTALENNTPTPTPTKQTFRVFFYPNNGANNFYQDVEEGSTLTPVTNPANEGYTFNGWHQGDENGPVWNFSTAVTGNMTLVAGWTQNEQPTPQEPIRPSSISISGPSTVQVGSTIELYATITPPNADADINVTWSSSDQSIATNNGGFITGVAEGDVVVTATTANGKTATHNVAVTQEPQSEYRLVITAAGDKRNLLIGENVGLTATIVNTQDSSDTKTEQITWTSSDSALSVSSTGQMTADATANSAIANVTVTATSASGLTNQLTFVITDPTVYPESVTVSPETIHVGENKGLNVVVAPSDAAYSLTYESADTSIFTVSNNGFVTGVSTGSANVTVRTQNGKTSSATITVIPAAIAPSTITVSGAIPLYIGSGVDAQHPNTCELTAVVGPEGASQEVYWEAAYPTIANVSSAQPTTNGITVTAISVGTTRVYARSTQNSEITGYTEITVTNIDAQEPQPETSLIIEPVFPNNKPNETWGYDSNDNLQLAQRTSGQFNAYIKNGADGAKSPVNVTWSSSVENVRIHSGGDVDDAANTGTGTFTLFGSDLVDPSTSTVTITATSSEYGSTSKVVKLFRADSEPWPTTQLEIDDMTLSVGDTERVNVSIWRPNINEDGKQPYSGTYDTFDGSITTPQFISSDESVFTVDQDGYVTAVGEGEATLTMKTHYLSTEFDIHYASVNHVAEIWSEGVSATATITVGN